MHFNRRKFSGALEVLFHLIVFGIKNAKIHFFEERGDLSTFYRIELWVVTNMSNRHEKQPHKILETLLRAEVLRIFKILHFSILLKIISSTC